ncbi:MAG: hypothetical protein AseanaTS_09760 [Candidatus Pelagadaptatus aseana]|uniref:hypothetical protein n=1 Tax=Candidatus Pelagadaptatus aseana TaxID=3120508 RepID=UPI0039B2059E
MTNIPSINPDVPLSSKVIIGSGDAAKENVAKEEGPTPEDINERVRKIEETLESRKAENSDQQSQKRATVSETHTAMRQKDLVELYISLSSGTDAPDSQTLVVTDSDTSRFEELLGQLKSDQDSFMEHLRNLIDRDYRNPIEETPTPEGVKGTLLDIQA